MSPPKRRPNHTLTWPLSTGQVSKLQKLKKKKKKSEITEKNMSQRVCFKTTCLQVANVLVLVLLIFSTTVYSAQTNPNTASISHNHYTGSVRLARSLVQLDRLIEAGKNGSSSDLPRHGCQSAGSESSGGSLNQTFLGAEDASSNLSFGYTQSQISSFVRPVFYTLRIKVDPTKRKFTGQLMITLDVLGPGEQVSEQDANSNSDNNSSNTTTARNKSGELGYRYLTLHAGSNIHIRKAFYVFTLRSGLQIPATKIGKNVQNELLTLDFHPNVITAGQGLLLLVYTGAVNESDSQGLFVHHSQKPGRRAATSGPRSAGTGGAGGGGAAIDLDAGLATQMQPYFARRLLPSWDEPHLKARFSLIVVLPFRGYQAISNMLVKRKAILLSCSGESLQEIEFFTTPTMSTYLLTLVVGRFEHVESIAANNCKVRAYVYANHNHHHLSSGQPANSTGVQVTTTNSDATTTSGENLRLPAAQTALQVAVKALERLEELLGVKYPLTKFDMIALRDFNNGGMENWGAAIFHENYLLFDNTTQAHQEIMVNGGRQRPKRLVVPLVVAHELAHQWFGNLLTAHTWTYLWLNEGFAQLFMYELADWMYPNENFWHIFVEDNRQSAMREDELLSTSRALEYEEQVQPPPSADQLQNNANTTATTTTTTTDWLNMFDQLTYNKGAMMVRMIYHLLGREHFFQGLQHYLLKHSYGTVTSHDLFLALEETTGRAERQLESFMRGWLHQEGFPLLSVQVHDEGAHFRLRISQERFLLLSSVDSPSMNGQPQSAVNLSSSWQVPVTFSSELNPMPAEWQLSRPQRNLPSASFQIPSQPRTSTLLLPKSSTGSWFKLNFNATGYFRVDYKLTVNPDGSLPAAAPMAAGNGGNNGNTNNRVDLLANMIGAIKAKSMCVIDRFNLLDDLFAMVRSGRKPTAYYLRFLIEAYDEETEIIVLRPIVESLKLIRSAIVSNSQAAELANLFERYVQKYLRRLADHSVSSRRTAAASASASTSASTHQQLKEIEDLIGAALVAFNEPQAVQQAAEVFSRHFRSQQSSTTSASTWKSPLDSMDRETRASVYGAALAAQSVDVDAPSSPSPSSPPPLNDELLAPMKPHVGAGSYVTSSSEDPILAAHSSLSSIFASSSALSAAGSWWSLTSNATQQQQQQQSDRREQSSQSSLSTAPPNVNEQQQQQQQDAFKRLLKAYESSELGAEKIAIASALGTTSQPSEQLKLLNLTTYFRLQDSAALMESLARSRSGRQLIWNSILSNSEQLERRQLFSVALKSLASGLIEPQQQQQQSSSSSSSAPPLPQPQLNHLQQPPAAGEVEARLRSLYNSFSGQYNKLISQTIELVRINTRWFRQDHNARRTPPVGAPERLPNPAALIAAPPNPQVRTVNPGDRVNIPCSLANMGGSIQFAKDDQPIILDSGCAHCQLDISNDGQASLTINRVSSKDQGHWQCWRLDANGKVKQKIPIIQLVITNSPELPILIVNDKELLGGNSLDATITVKENEMVSFKCVIKGATSPVDYVHWMLDSSQNVTHMSQLMMEYSPVENNYLTQSILKLNATKSMNLKSISCLSNHQLWLTPMTVTAFLNVLYEPSFTISREPGFGIPVSEGMTVILKCEIDSNPSSAPVWIKDADNKTANAANQQQQQQQQSAAQQQQQVTGKEASGEPIVLDTQDDGSVIFQPAQRSDSGWYRCKTENKYGNFSSFGYYLNVRPSSASATASAAAAAAPAPQHLAHQLNSNHQPAPTSKPFYAQSPVASRPEAFYGAQQQVGGKILAPNQPAAQKSNQRSSGGGSSSMLSQSFSSSNMVNNDQPSIGQQSAFGGQPLLGSPESRCEPSRVDGSPRIDPPVSTVSAVLGRPLVLPLRFCCNPGPAHVFWIHRHLAMIPGRMFGPYITRDIYNAYNNFYCYESTFEIESVKPEDIGTVYVFVSNEKGHAGAQVHIQLANKHEHSSLGSRFTLSSSASSAGYSVILNTCLLAFTTMLTLLHHHHYNNAHRHHHHHHHHHHHPVSRLWISNR